MSILSNLTLHVFLNEITMCAKKINNTQWSTIK
jgi:hypothetical protein